MRKGSSFHMCDGCQELQKFLVSSLSQQSASPHGGFFAVASDDFRPAAVHRGNPEKGAACVGIVSSKDGDKFGSQDDHWWLMMG